MKAKIKYYLTDRFFAILTVDISIPADQAATAEANGSDKEEQANLVGQAMQTVQALLGNSDEA